MMDVFFDEKEKVWRKLPEVRTVIEFETKEEQEEFEKILGQNTLRDIKEALDDVKKNCENCVHLIRWNDIEKYGECECTSFIFRSFEVDTRKTKCSEWKDCME